jgi:hypothetical protein
MKYLGFIIDETFSTIEHAKSKNKILMKQTYALFNTGLLGRSMDISTQSFIYKTYCRPSMLYGLDLIELNEKTIYLSRVDEGIILKRILAKASRTTICYQSLEVQEILLLSMIMKIKLMKRLNLNEFTKEIIKESIQLNAIRPVKGTLVEETKEIRNIFGIDNINNNSIKIMKKKILTYEEDLKDRELINKIKFCVKNRNIDESLNKLLHESVSFRR